MRIRNACTCICVLCTYICYVHVIIFNLNIFNFLPLKCIILFFYNTDDTQIIDKDKKKYTTHQVDMLRH